MFKYGAFVLMLAALGCKQKAHPAIDTADFSRLPEDFKAFYEKFHADSAYQMAHVQFPLEGYPAQADSLTDVNFRWTADKWRMHRLDGFNEQDYIRKFESPMPSLVTEVIMQKNTPFGTYRRFYKRDNEWYLIFYSDMNSMKTQ